MNMMFNKQVGKLLASATAAACLSGMSWAAPLTVDVFNPGTKSIFPVTSTILYSEKEALLVDAQFQKNDAQQLVDKIKKSGKELTTVFISHSDPDFYFGLDTIKKAFPKAKVYSTAQTAYLIKATKDDKMVVWKDQLKENAPAALYVPTPINSDKLVFANHTLEIKGADINPSNTYLWVPELKTTVGGIQLTANTHLWLADSQKKQQRQAWIKQLEQMEQLKPQQVIPSHFVNMPAKGFGVELIKANKEYLQRFEQALATAPNSAAIINKLKPLYPNFKDDSSLVLSAKVLTGEMPWKYVNAYPLVAKKAKVTFGDMAFELNFKDHETMTFVGLSGQGMKGVTDTVKYTAVEISDGVYMVYWVEPHLGAKVVHVQNFNNHEVYTNIFNKDGSEYHLRGTIEKLN